MFDRDRHQPAHFGNESIEGGASTRMSMPSSIVNGLQGVKATEGTFELPREGLCGLVASLVHLVVLVTSDNRDH
jgi:hypothetical protein